MQSSGLSLAGSCAPPGAPGMPLQPLGLGSTLGDGDYNFHTADMDKYMTEEQHMDTASTQIPHIASPQGTRWDRAPWDPQLSAGSRGWRQALGCTMQTLAEGSEHRDMGAVSE